MSPKLTSLTLILYHLNVIATLLRVRRSSFFFFFWYIYTANLSYTRYKDLSQYEYQKYHRRIRPASDSRQISIFQIFPMHDIRATPNVYISISIRVYVHVYSNLCRCRCRCRRRTSPSPYVWLSTAYSVDTAERRVFSVFVTSTRGRYLYRVQMPKQSNKRFDVRFRPPENAPDIFRQRFFRNFLPLEKIHFL